MTTPSACHPLTLTRDLAEFPIASRPLREHQSAIRASAPYPLAIRPDAWIAPADMKLLVPDGPSTLVADDSTPLAWLGESPAPELVVTAAESFRVVHPWDLLRANELALGLLGNDRIEGEIHPSAVIDGILHLGAGSRILPGVHIEGTVVIGADCRIGPNCHLRGETSIGDRCHIGQAVEIKNSILLSDTWIGHLSYLGDSILGEGVNFGAGTIVSNFRHDGKPHHSMVDGQLVDTGRVKFGTVIGDGVHTGIHTSIYPGRKLWPGTTTRPGEIVQSDIVA
jgi:bifunctional UDP-N-acetylglucosamine pyrophosphorylase/glucosamine-1-phosphate N-acetyltransferase